MGGRYESPNEPFLHSHVVNKCLTNDQVLLLPTIFAKLEEKTLYLFGAVNVVTIVVVWALYPETNQRTLEEMDLVFASDSIWNWDAERNFKILKEQNPELVQAAQRGNSVVDPEAGFKGGRQGSLVPKDLSLEAKEYGNSSEEEKVTEGVKHDRLWGAFDVVGPSGVLHATSFERLLWFAEIVDMGIGERRLDCGGWVLLSWRGS